MKLPTVKIVLLERSLYQRIVIASRDVSVDIDGSGGVVKESLMRWCV